jgi:hypothetical protein
LLELTWWHIAKCRVQALLIIDLFEKLSYAGAGFCQRLILEEIDFFI